MDTNQEYSSSEKPKNLTLSEEELLLLKKELEANKNKIETINRLTVEKISRLQSELDYTKSMVIFILNNLQEK